MMAFHCSESGCHVWMGSVNKKGYPEDEDGKVYRRVVLESGREIPFGHHVDHVCCNVLCINPEHLEVVTPEENFRRCRQNAGKKLTYCHNGHERMAGRACRECKPKNTKKKVGPRKQLLRLEKEYGLWARKWAEALK